MHNAFYGNSLTVVNDFSTEQQLFLYEKTRELKERIRNGGNIDEFRIDDEDISVYLMFLEDSTRTKESFLNAAKFHGTRVNVFDAKGSSFNKKESITDTVRMLYGYSKQSLFIVRSKEEGLCRWLEHSLGNYAESIGAPKPCFINGGDGKHEHPTQELLDEFSFLEKKQWDRSHIHLALVGDLFHGRTVHSKADGLKVFNDVTVDLIAPEELGMPRSYVDKMKSNGFSINYYSTIDEYLASEKTAPIWYFTRLQLERMGDEILDKEDFLRSAVTFTEDHFSRIPDGTVFFHPLPRHRENPTIPSFLDLTPLNGWDAQSINGYYTRIIEIGLLIGSIGNSYKGPAPVIDNFSDDFINSSPVKPGKVHEYKVGIKPVENGIVIDHIAKGKDLKNIWNSIEKIRKILDLNIRSSHGVFHSNEAPDFKGIISLPDVLSFDEKQLKMLAAIAPGCTLNIIKNSKVLKKYRLNMPPRVYNFDQISCKNENCISHPDLCESVQPEFYRSVESRFICKYCEKSHDFQEIWDL